MNIKILILITIEQKSWQKKSLLMNAKLTQAHGRWTSNKETKQNQKKPQKKISISISPFPT